jgi:hypothetical protein
LSLAICLVAVLASLFLLPAPLAQAQNGRPVLISQNVDESKLATLEGNTPPEANQKNDRGLVADNLSMEHMMLQLRRSPEQERELRQFIEELTDSSSPNFHHWLTAKEFGQTFGLATQDLDAITRWLESHGFKVNVVYENGMLIDFSGTASQVRAAFHTEIHQLNVKGVKHIANMSDPRIPAALAPAVVGVVSLHDFKPHTNYKPRSSYTTAGGYYAVVPADLAMIYNLNPLFTAGTSGQGQTIVVVENTDVFTAADWTTFRSTFGLSSYTSGSFTQVHPAPPTGTNNCTPPGVNGDDGEATLDAEYASAAAPSATIELASCSDTSTFGGLIAMQNLLNESSAPPAIMSMSYGYCEAGNGASSNAAFSAAYQQAVTEGVSVFVSAGDEGAASCDPAPPTGPNSATHGIGVSAFASTPYNVAVGGTDFGDTYAGTNSTYWSATNSPTYESALSYVPEIPWNDSCASLLGALYSGFPQTYGSTGFCNNSTNQTTVSGSGGPSGCATGTPSVSGVVGGTCAGWPKPSWQSLVGVPTDGVRDIPDVSLFAANGIWGHYYPFCFSDTSNGGVACTGTPDNWAGAGGTSFSAPIMAGIQALVNQHAGGPQGNPNPVYYSLAATEYGATGDSSCNSTLGNTVSSSCVFYDVTLGDMDVNCTGTNNCYLPSGTFGVLSTSNSSYLPAYGTTTGWDFATGIGTVNAANLVSNWPGAATTTTVTSSQNPAYQGASVTFTATVATVGSHAPTGTVNFNDGATIIGSGTLGPVSGSQVATYTTSTLTVGSHSITAVYAGDTNNAGSTSSVLTQTINVIPTFTFVSTSGTVTSHTVKSGQTSLSYSFTATPTSGSTFVNAVNLSCTAFAPPDPTLTSSSCTFSPSATIAAESHASTVTMTISSVGPNNGPGSSLQHRADNRRPWLPLTLPLAGVVMVGFARRKMSRVATVAGMCLMLALAGFLIACGGSSPPVSITSVTGSSASIYPQNVGWTNATATFTAVLANDSGNKGVTWAVSTTNGGTIGSTTGIYTPPTIAAGLPSNVTITATSVADTSKTGTATIALNPATVPNAGYNVTVTASESGATSQTANVTLIVQ